MKTAVFYSGQARTFANCWPNQFWNVLRRLPDPHFFVSVADDAEGRSMEALKTRFKNVEIEYLKQPDFPEADEWARKYSHGGYGISAQPQNIVRAFWGYKKAWEMKPKDAAFDMYVRIRPDLWFQEFEMPSALNWYPSLCMTAPWGSYGGINDRFAILGYQAARYYFTAFDRLQELLAKGAPFHPESLTRAALETDLGEVNIRQTLIAEFKIRRMASARHPQLNPNGDREWLVPEPILGIELLRATLGK